jgi:hypothetical protein
MNVDELRAGLSTLAAEAATAPVGELADAHTRLAGVDQKVARSRRTRIAVVAGAAAAVVGAAGLVASELPHESAAPPASGLPTVSENGISLYTAPAGGRLIGHVVSAPGVRSATVTVAPSTLDLAWEVECSGAGTGTSGKGSPSFTLTVNGRPISSGDCSGAADGTPMNYGAYFGHGAPAGNAAGWRDLGLRPGSPATFAIRMTGPIAAGARPQLAFGLWQRGPQDHASGVWYPHQQVVDGVTYQAESLSTDPFTSRRAAISVPLGTQYDRYWITGGAQQLDGGNGVLQVGNGAMAALDTAGGAELGAGYNVPHAPVPVTFKSNHGAVSGVLYAIVYHPLDGP